MTTIAFLHGFTGSPQSFDAARSSLPFECRVCSPALLGHAGGPVSGATFDQEMQRLRAVIRSECPEPAVLIGYSLGARLALGIAAADPHGIAALVLISVNPGLQSAEERKARAASDEEHAAFLEAHGTAAFIEQRWAKQPLFASQHRLSANLLTAQNEQRMRHEPRGLA
ncbi:MAG TPA: alpha/beta fold hydrolase, partial [Polyangiaceae bacterium]|nr:alpha/beta fold hydrolase [Polyangiaceae bacterium]